MNTPRYCFLVILLGLLAAARHHAQEYGPPDRGAPGDEMIQAYLAAEATRLHASFTNDVRSPADWESRRAVWREEYLYMLGLWPLPARTPLHAAVTGTLEGDGYRVDLVHYQSRPRLYVTGNLYRPAGGGAGGRLPAVLYVCGHSNQGRSGNKTAYQSHGIWFARHGYVCLMVDSLQLGEIAAIHHGTYRENRWWWHSRGYTPAGVECWNGIRGIDYLVSRPDVDPERIAVTGISGGGAATFWIAAADGRVKVAVPVSGMADLPSYVTNRVINGHCDCMFLHNTFQWPWTRIAALIAPRAQLFANSDADRIFPMDANERVIARLERVYSLHGRSDWVDAVVSIGGHAYRQDLRQAAYRFINAHLKHDPRPVDDSEVDLVTGDPKNRLYPIPLDRLRVFPQESDIPRDELNTAIDRHFVPMASVDPPTARSFPDWKNTLLAELRRVSFRTFPERIPPARWRARGQAAEAHIETEPGIAVRLLELTNAPAAPGPTRLLLGIGDADSGGSFIGMLRGLGRPGEAVYLCEPRGMGATRWTEKNPPNYVKRSHALLGSTVDTGRVRDVIAAARALRGRHGGQVPLTVVGEGAAAVLAAYAALLEPEISGAVLRRPLLTHMDAAAPQFLNVLRVCDVPDALGMLAPRPLRVLGPADKPLEKTAAIYVAAGAKDQFTVQAE
ncbi:MAG: prolyl oligopeptidase family serine peptidase [Verrucomicrobia bacterium]|nr:prolyl oligopeptidase family serine peptidase [Verrucomicrobiota bacterium]